MTLATALRSSALMALLACSAPLDLGRQEACLGDAVACAGAPSRCVDVRTDPRHCGACGAACEAGGRCVAGRCCSGAVCAGRCMGSTFETLEARAGREVTGMYLQDIDRDGYDDLAAVNQLDENMYVFWGNPEGRLGEPSVWPIGRVNGDVAFGDVDMDGTADVVATVQSHGPPHPDRLGVYVRRPGRELGAATLLPESGDPDELVLGDFDGDGRPDVLTRRMLTGCLLLRPGDGRGGFGEGRCVATLTTGPEGPTPMTAADLDGDGAPEVVIRVGERFEAFDFGPGGAVASRTELLSYAGAFPEYVVAVGADRDRRPELARLRRSAPSGYAMEVLVAGGADASPPTCPVATGFGRNLWTAGDFNGDGLLDAAGIQGCMGCPETALLHLRR